MSALAREVAAVQASNRRRLAGVREKERREQTRFDARLLALLRVRIRPDDLARVEAQARRELDRERDERSSRARASRARGAGDSTPVLRTAADSASTPGVKGLRPLQDASRGPTR
jgi:hypothetical protein